MKGLWLLIVAMIVSAAAACQKQQGEQAGTTEETAAVDAAAVEQTIRSAADGFVQAALAGDVETWVSFYADDAILQPPGMPRSEGKDAIRSAVQQLFAPGNPTAFSLNSGTVFVSESGDVAYEVGTYSWTGPGPDGQSATDNGKYLVVWKPTATGEWKIAVDTWNSDAMPGTTLGEAATPAGQ